MWCEERVLGHKVRQEWGRSPLFLPQMGLWVGLLIWSTVKCRDTTKARLRDIVQYRAGGIRTLMRLLSADFKSSGLHTQRDHNIQYLCCCALLCVVCSSLCSFLPFQRVFWTENPFHSSEKSAGLRVRNPGTTRINLVRAIPFRGDMCVHNGKYIRSRELVKPTRFLSAVHVGSLWAVLRLPDLRQLSGAELHPSKRCSSPSSSS